MCAGVCSMPETVVSNSGPLIHLSEVQQLQLFQLFKQVLIPQRVLEEAGKISTHLKNVTVIALDEKEIKVTAEKLKEFKVHAGELQALHLAYKTKALFLTDDLEAREAATSLSLEVHGTLGIVALAYHQKMIDKEEAIRIMHQLYTNSSLYLTRFIMEEALRLLQ